VFQLASAGLLVWATLPYIPGDKAGIDFATGRSLSEITPDQMRRFADTTRIRQGPLWKITVKTAGSTAENP